MIAETPQNLVIGLLLVSLLSAVMGYIIASIRASKHTKSERQTIQAEMIRARADTDAELSLLSSERSQFQSSLREANERASAAKKKEESLELHTQFLSQRIQSLESQVSSYEEQQIRLQRDFAAYKSNKARELELARIKPESWSQTGHLPVLNKRIPHDESLMSRSFPASQVRDSQNLRKSNGTNNELPRSVSRTSLPNRSHTKLSLPLSQELDFPTLAESELPDSVEELEFELVDFDTERDNPRG